jgi:hypothetical protein
LPLLSTSLLPLLSISLLPLLTADPDPEHDFV